MKYLVFVFGLIITFATGTELLTNGNFEQPLNIGWHYDTSATNWFFNSSPQYHPDLDKEAYVRKTNAGYLRLYQQVPITSTDINFSVTAKFLVGGGSSTCIPAAAISIRYLGGFGNHLGATRIYSSTYPVWYNSDTVHLIVGDSLWHDYSFNLQGELANLPGVNPADVHLIEVGLLAYCTSG